MHRPTVLLMSGLASLALPAAAQDIDMQAMQRWASAKVIYYAVEGVYSGKTAVTRQSGGFADVTDKIGMTFEWNLGEARMVKLTSLRNHPSEVKNLRDGEPKCMAPVLEGPFEFSTATDVANGLGGAIDVTMERSYPDVGVAQFCTASHKLIRAEKKTDRETIPVPAPTLLAMGMGLPPELAFSADKKSIVYTKGPWRWTFTPSTTAPKSIRAGAARQQRPA